MGQNGQSEGWEAIELDEGKAAKLDLTTITNFPRRGCTYRVHQEIGETLMLVCSTPLSTKDWERVVIQAGLVTDCEASEEEEDTALGIAMTHADIAASYQRL